MKLPHCLTTVTPFSKALALSMFVVFPIVTFYLGMNFQQRITLQPISTEKIVQVPRIETERDLIERCGAFDGSKFSVPQQHFDAVTGPMWAPDCRHAAWANWQSGTGDPTEETPVFMRTISPREGLYLYDDHTNKVKRIYVPKTLDEITQLLRWDDSQTIIFSTSSGTFRYNLVDGQISSN